MAVRTGRERQQRNGSKNGGGSSGSALAKGLLLAGAAVGAAAAANAYIFYKTPPLTSRLPGGDVRYFATPLGDIFYKKAGSGPPLLLVHGIEPGASSFEFRHVFAPLAERHTVYALDLLGFGKSDKPRIAYTDDVYIGLLDDFARQVMGVGGGRGEADVVAAGLSAAYAIALSRRDATIFRRLVLVCPTGIEDLAGEPSVTAASALRGVLQAPVVGSTLYNLTASRRALGRHLAHDLYADPARVTEDIVDEYHIAAHQPGGDHVLPSFWSGLMNVDIADDFSHIGDDLPLLVWGRDAKRPPLGHSEPFLRANDRAKLEVIEKAGALPHAEQPEAFLIAVRPFLQAAEPAPAAAAA